jgi:hypothetical protein
MGIGSWRSVIIQPMRKTKQTSLHPDRLPL